MRVEAHILAALQGIASKKWHGKGCKRSNCGEVCLCAACHARVALAMLEKRDMKQFIVMPVRS